jgi:hypothetical protein
MRDCARNRRRERWTGRVLSGLVMLASTQLPLLAGHAAQAEASALPAPPASTPAADTVFAISGSTWLKADSADDGFAQMWHNPDCDSAGKQPNCTYLGGPHRVQSFLLQDDSSVVKPWTAAPNAATADFSAVAGLTSCFHGTASCLSTDTNRDLV